MGSPSRVNMLFVKLNLPEFPVVLFGLVDLTSVCLYFYIAPQVGFKIPGYKPSEMDKKFLLWSGRFKTVDQIPEFVS